MKRAEKTSSSFRAHPAIIPRLLILNRSSRDIWKRPEDLQSLPAWKQRRVRWSKIFDIKVWIFVLWILYQLSDELFSHCGYYGWGIRAGQDPVLNLNTNASKSRFTIRLTEMAAWLKVEDSAESWLYLSGSILGLPANHRCSFPLP